MTLLQILCDSEVLNYKVRMKICWKPKGEIWTVSCTSNQQDTAAREPHQSDIEKDWHPKISIQLLKPFELIWMSDLLIHYSDTRDHLCKTDDGVDNEIVNMNLTLSEKKKWKQM